MSLRMVIPYPLFLLDSGLRRKDGRRGRNDGGSGERLTFTSLGEMWAMNYGYGIRQRDELDGIVVPDPLHRHILRG